MCNISAHTNNARHIRMRTVESRRTRSIGRNRTRTSSRDRDRDITSNHHRDHASNCYCVGNIHRASIIVVNRIVTGSAMGNRECESNDKNWRLR